MNRRRLRGNMCFDALASMSAAVVIKAGGLVSKRNSSQASFPPSLVSRFWEHHMPGSTVRRLAVFYCIAGFALVGLLTCAGL